MLGRPALLGRSPYVAENHQEKNARALEQKGACQVITEPECTPEKLYHAVIDLLADNEKLAEMGRCAKTMAILDSSEKIYQYILEAARK